MLSFDCGCKGKDFFLTAKFFRRKISESFFQAAGRLNMSLSFANLIPLSGLPSIIMLTAAVLSRMRVQK